MSSSTLPPFCLGTSIGRWHFSAAAGCALAAWALAWWLVTNLGFGILAAVACERRRAH